ncbi:hypothetical protein AB1Y20_019362 [Prymnesium parvum]|uniref:Phospholipid/glycerol acyltransferase domain-containing protein n=1 Tax=Prymnesium parvum TaxID=97485 RepID=A0AB34JU99_PRYPA
MERARAALLLGALVSTALFGTVYAILPAAVALLVPAGLLLRSSPRVGTAVWLSYRSLVDSIAALWFTLASALIEWLGGTRVVVRGNGASPVPPDERVSLLICNHHCRLDWMYLWCFCARLAICRRLKIALKAPLKKVPFFGWAMQAFFFVFLTRGDKESDLSRLRRNLEHCMAAGPMALLIFPEGTDLSPTNLAVSHKHAASHGLPQYSHVLHPRTAGFVSCVLTLGDRLDAVYDLTITYENHPSVAASSDPRPAEGHLIAGTPPRGVHVFAERFERSQLPSAEPALKQWLVERWAMKEAALGRPSSSSQALAEDEHVRDGMRSEYRCSLAVGALSFLLFLWGLSRSIYAWVYLLAGCALFVIITWAGGLDNFELWLCAPARNKKVDLL